MLFSAVSLFVIASVGSTHSTQQINAIWKKIEPSIGTVKSNGSVSGVAALIDDNGLFLVHANSVGGGSLRITFDDKSEVSAIVVATDEQTQLSLLKALVWTQGRRQVLSVSKESSPAQIPVLAATAGGPKTGEFIADGKAGVMKPSLRYVPLSEIRLESNDAQIGGAIVFNSEGEIFGLLGASLVQQASQQKTVRLGLGSQPSAAITALESLSRSKFGPTGVTVAYALGREVVGRVVEGFKSADHKVHHPTIGMFFKSSPSGKGVIVESVMSGSPSASAGLMPGDEIYEIDGVPTNNAVELAIALFKKNVGESVTLRYGRESLRGSVTVSVVSSQTAPGL